MSEAFHTDATDNHGAYVGGVDGLAVWVRERQKLISFSSHQVVICVLSHQQEAAMFQTILLAYDGTREGKSALLACTEIASFAKMDTHLHLLAVATRPSSRFMTDGYFPWDIVDTQRKHGQDVLDKGTKQFREKGFSITAHLAIGEPVEEICRLAADLKADLIVVGHQKNTSFASRWWRRSVGKALLDKTPCSIFVARTR
jgi:nucleotide-binding universal stress UspA family protein